MRHIALTLLSDLTISFQYGWLINQFTSIQRLIIPNILRVVSIDRSLSNVVNFPLTLLRALFIRIISISGIIDKQKNIVRRVDGSK